MASVGLEVKVDGKWLRQFGAWGSLTYSHSTQGPREASWEMSTRYGARLPLIRRGANVQIFWGGWLIWAGYLMEPEWNGGSVSLTANGLFRSGERWMAFTDASATTTTSNPTLAINAATGIGWTVGPGVPNAELTSVTQPVNTLSALLDAWAKSLNQRWSVDQFGVVRMESDPTSPRYLIRAGSGDLGIADDDYASHVVLIYQNVSSGYSTAVYPGPLRGGAPNAYEKEYGHSESVQDVTDLGPITDVQAAGLAQSTYEGSLQRPGWTNGLQLGYGEILTRGWRPIHPAAVNARHVSARHLGVPDEVRLTQSTDFVVDNTQYVDGSGQVTVNPVGLVSRSQEDVLTELLEAVSA